MNPTIREERLKVATVHGGQIFLRRLEQQQTHAAVLMLHGLGANGDAFIKEGHGLANYLSEMGFSCFVPDMVGHGHSWPHMSRHLEHSVHDVINKDIPKIIEEIERDLNGKPLFLVGQGFGSVILMSAYAKSERLQALTDGFIHFNARRSVTISGVSHSLGSRLLWRKMLPFIASIRGDVPVHWTGHGNQPELLTWYNTSLSWSEGDWVDPQDAFNYGAALRDLSLPPSLYFANRSQDYLTHTADVREFMRELGTHNGRLMILAKGDGNLRNYNSMTMLQHDDAWVDHFPVVLDWLNERVRQSNP
ncbi:MAG: alpha/beta fold hydrolase [Reinekea sp.]|jgi:alpha-beta hydrolase superfamily lysophospholipase|nr:alpha/beta fold hydrolase [Reinekea sp.]